MNEEKSIEHEARRILNDVVANGTYNAGHIIWIVNLAKSERIRLQNELKDLLGVRECNE